MPQEENFFEIETPVTNISGVGRKTAYALSKLNIRTIEDLFFFIPRRYEDRQKVIQLKDVQNGQFFCALAMVTSYKTDYAHDLTEATISDGTGKIKATWFSARIAQCFEYNSKIAFYGKASEFNGELCITHPKFEVMDEYAPPTIIGRIFPIYAANADLSQNSIAKLIDKAFKAYSDICLDEFLPQKILDKYKMLSLREALIQIHNPLNATMYRRARSRLAFDELFLLQCGILMRRNYYLQYANKSIRIKPGKYYEAFRNDLQFTLTNAQERVISEIFADLEKDFPMNRLLQGDVGSGKTLVAFCAILAAIDSGVQAAFMAPTEVLADQHFIKLQKSLEPLGIKTALLTGSMKQSERKIILESLENGEINVIVGTHAIFAEQVNFRELGLVIIDEQHRFGVLQRNALASKGISPHVLSMTATPIPRTIVMSNYGDLAVSEIDEMPPGREKIETIAIDSRDTRRLAKMIHDAIVEKHQVYWVCPTIEEGDRGLSAVTSRFSDLQKFSHDGEFFKVEMLHGQMSGDEKKRIMQEFSDGKIDLLVSTVVIEVGVDVPNATLMIIEDAGQFGLAQLHQLRGRIGRGKSASTCVLLFGASTTGDGRKRIEFMTKISNGFRLSEMDLFQRGPGEICGVHQHGVTDFRVANLLRDYKILRVARKEAIDLLSEDANLESEPALKSELLRRLGNALELAITA